MTDRLVPSALREVRSDLIKRPSIVGMLAAGIILGISGPFGTIEFMPLGARLLYWTSVVILTYGIGSLVSCLVHATLPQHTAAVKILLSICALGVTLTAVLTALNLLVFGMWYTDWPSFFGLLGAVTLISAVVEICGNLLRANDPNAKGTALSPPPLLQRLPLEKRGPLIALSAEDHYVRVTTTRGEDLVLMRFADAIAEVGSTAGLQIHRSHWVALEQIRSITRTGDRGEATLSDQTTRPISRGYMAAVRDAGLLPQGRGG